VNKRPLLSLGLIVACFLQATIVHAENASKGRIVSIDGSITETIYALGAGDRLVGVDTTSRFPAETIKLPNVGYMRALSAEGIMSLAPELVITSKDAGPAAVLEQLDSAGLEIEYIPNEYSIEGLKEKVQRIAAILNRNPEGERLIDDINQSTQYLSEEVSARQANGAPVPRVMFLLAAGGHGVSLAGTETQADALIRLLGGANVATTHSSYKPLTPEAAVTTQPDVIVIAETRKGEDSFEKFPSLKLTPAFQNQRIIKADSMLLLGFGPRLPAAMHLLLDSFYPVANNTLNNY